MIRTSVVRVYRLPSSSDRFFRRLIKRFGFPDTRRHGIKTANEPRLAVRALLYTSDGCMCVCVRARFNYAALYNNNRTHYYYVVIMCWTAAATAVYLTSVACATIDKHVVNSRMCARVDKK